MNHRFTDRTLELPTGSTTIALSRLEEIAIVDETTTKKAAKKWRSGNSGEYSELLNATPD